MNEKKVKQLNGLLRQAHRIGSAILAEFQGSSGETKSAKLIRAKGRTFESEAHNLTKQVSTRRLRREKEDQSRRSAVRKRPTTQRSEGRATRPREGNPERTAETDQRRAAREQRRLGLGRPNERPNAENRMTEEKRAERARERAEKDDHRLLRDERRMRVLERSAGNTPDSSGQSSHRNGKASREERQKKSEKRRARRTANPAKSRAALGSDKVKTA